MQMSWTEAQFDAWHTHINSQHTRTALARINWIGLASFWAPFSIVIESNNITYTMPKTVYGWFPPITATPLLQLYSQLKALYWHHTCECNLCRCLVIKEATSSGGACVNIVAAICEPDKTLLVLSRTLAISFP